MAEVVRWDWVERHADDIVRHSVEHLQLVGASLALAVAVALPLAIAVRNRRAPYVAVNALAGALYTVPSLAMFAFLLALVGIGFQPAVIALALYSLQMIIRNAVVGLRGVPAPVREAARGMGLTPWQTLVRVELPLALPAIMAGVRLAAVSTVGIATIAVYIGGGGLGVLIVNDGIQRALFTTPIIVGAVVATVMAIAIDLLLVGLERVLTPWQRARRAA
ncbi:ABC transporter permease [Miltoncostaea marina]|uniref:ABC transporter permease n=1 Tax=Miltoncostaea marina TaxID=2843215 RepID=UPI001C3E391C|nr:ABC transporter permease [Miltoncostaea marina]